MPPATIVLQRGEGVNVHDVDGNRYVDLAAGFGALLLGHSPEAVLRAVELQSGRLLQALGDVHPSDAKIGLLERLARLYPESGARVILGQSGADAVTAALKTVVLFTGRTGVIAFEGSYHGLSYAPLAVCGLRASYREPFADQLNAAIDFVEYPVDEAAADRALAEVRRLARRGGVGCILVEPILGRGGCVVPPSGFLGELSSLARDHDVLLVADEIWTGLGRSGAMLRSVSDGAVPDLICLGKGLGGGVPVSAVIGRESVMCSWEREEEVVHTATFSGAPLACTAALATLDVLSRHDLPSRAATVGDVFRRGLEEALPDGVEVRGLGLMIGIDLGTGAGAASRACRSLLERGYLASTGGGAREVLVLTPPLVVPEGLLTGCVPHLVASVQET